MENLEKSKRSTEEIENERQEVLMAIKLKREGAQKMKEEGIDTGNEADDMDMQDYIAKLHELNVEAGYPEEQPRLEGV